MKYVKALWENEKVWGVLKDDKVLFIKGTPYSGISYTGESAPLSSLKLCAPCDPTKIVAVGKNYYDHILEANAMHGETNIPKNATLFIKPSTALNDPDGEVAYPACSKRAGL